MPVALLREKLIRFLREDVGMGDITTEGVVPTGTRVRAQIIPREPAVVAGVSEVKALLEVLGINVVRSVGDGEEVRPGSVVMELEGEGRTILAAERTALNILMRMSGIATAVRELVRKVEGAGFRVRIAATRKTAPGLRYFDKRAVALGGGDTHRLRLDDAVLIKDNHIVIAGGVREAIKRARVITSFAKKVEVEVRTPEEALSAAESGADIVMLDNMTPERVEESIKVLERHGLRDKVLVEVSGGITKDNILTYAKRRPDIISLGSLTHSVQAIDMSLKVVEVRSDQ
ncbi:TPA: carboxylating nicotinate-nucleotide diphosphorylase [Candidatus Bathyarchaeota archaeon]|nr:carboxylating nicotinate-nucleotide diphosphorylase [Candidatus Bathyarchaeota archaeon]